MIVLVPRGFVRWVAILVLGIAIPGCDRVQAATQPSAPGAFIIGSAGNQPGRFVKPRAVAVAPDGTVWVMDRSGRLQAFDDRGNYLRGWIMRDVEKGTPEDIECDREGNILVTETHYAKITVYSPAGDVVREWGSWGKEPGQFIYPVGLAVDADGNVFVSEYGGNDRVQKFDRHGNFLLQWGRFGEARGEFTRPEDVCVDDRGRVYVADSCNHRIQVFDSSGALLDVWGEVGDAPGQLRYPYDVEIRPDGDLVVCEYGNHRVQRMTPEGRPRSSWGRVGRADGELNFPWDLAVDRQGRCLVADTQNHRVQRFTLD